MKWAFLRKHGAFILPIFIVIYFILTQVLFKADLGLNQRLKVVPIEIINSLYRNTNQDTLGNSRYAYVQYATNLEYLNLAIINFVILRESSTKIPNLVILFSKKLHLETGFQDLQKLSLKHSIKLKPISPIRVSDAESQIWEESFSKFHVFNEIDYDRIVYFDADSMILGNNWHDMTSETFAEIGHQPGNLDELFTIPLEIDIALPQAYWLSKDIKISRGTEIPSKESYRSKLYSIIAELSRTNNDSMLFEMLPTLLCDEHKFENKNNFFANHIMVVKPSKGMFEMLLKYVHNPWYWSITNRDALRSKSDYDMEILNRLIDDLLHTKSNLLKVGILPHQVYGVLTGEFKEDLHSKFLEEPHFLPFLKLGAIPEWLPLQIIPSIKLLHFSDSPIPKPWETQDNEHYYNAFKFYCKDDNFDPVLYDSIYPIWKPRLTNDCTSVNFWNWIMREHERLREYYWMI